MEVPQPVEFQLPAATDFWWSPAKDKRDWSRWGIGSANILSSKESVSQSRRVWLT
jgi:hypothetical protein